MKRFTLPLLAIVMIIAFCTTDGRAQQATGKVYWMSTTVVPFGKLQEFYAFQSKELIPVQEKNRYHFVAGWQSIIGDIEEVVVVAEFDNMDAYQKARASLLTSPEWKAMGLKMEGLTRSLRTRMLSALPYIKMK